MLLSRLVPSFLLVAVAAAPASADVVVLTNGKTFEDVIAQVDGDKVRIQLPYGGEISLPATKIERIDRSETAMERYLERKVALRRRADAGAADWVQLALWARGEGYEHGVREAALTAARLDPGAAEVAPLMRSLGYVLDDRLGDWVTREEALERSGLVRFRGEWVTREERDGRLRAEEERDRRRAERAREARLDRLTNAVTAVAELELARTLSQPQVAVAVPVYYPTVIWPGTFFIVGAPASPPGGTPAQAPGDRPPRPGSSHRHGHGTFESPFGGTLGPPDLIPGRLNPDASPPPGQLVSSRR